MEFTHYALFGMYSTIIYSVYRRWLNSVRQAKISMHVGVVSFATFAVLINIFVFKWGWQIKGIACAYTTFTVM